MNAFGSRMNRQAKRGFTLVELLVVILIILMLSAVALPVVLPAIQQRQVNEAARLFTAALGGARDAAIANNAPRGIRLLPDPVLTVPAVGASDAGAITWACNRFIPIEPAPDYREGLVEINDTYESALKSSTYRRYQHALVIFQSFKNAAPLTSWAWNIRVGDKLRFNETGHIYTVIGPVGPPYVLSQSGQAGMTLTQDPMDMVSRPNTDYPNPENFINYGDPGALPFSQQDGSTPEFLFLVNGVDDNQDGFVDNSFDGYDNNLDAYLDVPYILDPTSGTLTELDGEYEKEKWLRQEASWKQAGKPMSYTIKRRPVPSRGARETILPSNVVIDFTSWNRTDGFPGERSRLPYAFSPTVRYVDILINPNGQVSSDTTYAVPTSFEVNSPYFHFWFTDREGVVAPVWDMDTSVTPQVPKPNPNQDSTSLVPYYILPMPAGTSNYPSDGQPLTGQRLLVSIFARTGYTTTTSLESFNGNDVNQPYYDAQQGVKEAP